MTLFDAIESGDLRALRQQMRSGVDLEQIDEETITSPLALAAGCGHLDMVRILLWAGVDPNWGGATTPLEAATLEGHVDVVETLIAADADVNRPVADGFTPLLTAASTGHLDLVRLLVEAGASPFVVDDEGHSALDIAKREGHREVTAFLKQYLSNGHRPQGPAEHAFQAIRERDARRLKELVDEGGDDLGEAAREGLTPLAYAAQLGHLTLVRTLLEAGADIEDGGAWTPLFCAAEERHQPVVAALVEAGAQVDAPSGERRRTPLMAAAAGGDVETLRFLLDEGADAKVRDAQGKDALGHAAAAGQEQTFLLLAAGRSLEDRQEAEKELMQNVGFRRDLATGAARLIDLLHAGDFAAAKRQLASGVVDPDGFDEDGRTALMLAARAGRGDLVRMLITAGASFERIDDPDGFTALHHAIQGDAKGAHLTVSLLASAGADLDHPSADGRTPLMHAVDVVIERGDACSPRLTALIEPLLHLGADTTARDAFGRTVLMRIQERLLGEDTPAEERALLSRLRRFFEKAGVATTDGDHVELMTAVAEGHTGRLRELLEEVEDLDELAEFGVLTLAASSDQWDVVSQLVGAGIDINAPNGKGETLLMVAAAKGVQPIVEQLLQAGANASLKNEAGERAADYAADAGHDELAEILLKASRKRRAS